MVKNRKKKNCPLYVGHKLNQDNFTSRTSFNTLINSSPEPIILNIQQNDKELISNIHIEIYLQRLRKQLELKRQHSEVCKEITNNAIHDFIINLFITNIV